VKKVVNFVSLAIVVSLFLNLSFGGMTTVGASVPNKMAEGEIAESIGYALPSTDTIKAEDIGYFRELLSEKKFLENREKFDLKKEGIQKLDLGRGFELIREFKIVTTELKSTAIFQGVAATTWMKQPTTTYTWSYYGTPQYSFTQTASFLYDLTAVSFYSVSQSHQYLAAYWSAYGSGGGGNDSNTLAHATSNWTFSNSFWSMVRYESIRMYCNHLGGVWEG